MTKVRRDGPVQQRRLPLFRDCRMAARSIKGAEFGGEAIDTVRPRGSPGLLRARAPLALRLYVGSRDGLLIWRGSDSLALLQPPVGQRPGTADRRIWMSLLRAADRGWEILMFAAPPAVALLLALAAALYATTTPVGSTDRAAAVLFGMILLILALGYVAFLMSAGVIYGAWQIARALFRRQPEDTLAAELLPGVSWTMSLLHQSQPARADELLRAVSLRLKQTVSSAASSNVADAGAVAPDLDSAVTLVCLRSGITTQHMRDTVVEWTAGSGTFAPGSAVALKMPTNRQRRAPARTVEKGWFFLLYLFGMAASIVSMATTVADAEAEACAATSCEGRPVTFRLAIQWLAQRLLLNDPPGLSPATAGATVLGWLTSVMSIIAFLVLITAIQLYNRHRRELMAKWEREARRIGQRPRALIIVATEVERDAVFAEARGITGREADRWRLPHHTVYALGQIGEAEVLLAETQPGAVGPGGAAITASALISKLSPDYLLVTGICFGLRRGEQELGDIIVARQLRAIDHRKVTEGDGGRRVDLIRGDFVSASLTLYARFREPQVGWDRCRVHFGTMLSSSTLVNSKELCDELLKLDPEAQGGEMEGAGVYAAAAPEKVDWIVVKAISDWGYDKGDDAQPTAAANVAAFVLGAIRSGALDEAVG